MHNNHDGRSLPAPHQDGQHRSGILFPHPSPDWDRWIRNQADFLGTDDPEPPHPLQDYPRAPQVGGRDFRGDFRAIGRQAFGRAATVAPYLQLNPPNCYAALLLDVDDWRRAQNAIASASVPLPTWQARDRNTGRGHMGYALAEPVHANRTSSLPALHYLAAIENTLQRVMGADPAFAQRALTRNPWRPSLFQKNTWHPRTFALRELIPLCGLLPRPRARAAAAGLKRNATLFDCALTEAEALAWTLRKDDPLVSIDPILPALRAHVERLNRGFTVGPLPEPELSGIVRSVMRYARRWKHSKRRRGQIGGQLSGLARRPGSTAEREPWTEAGVSRRTWYRQRETVLALERTGDSAELARPWEAAGVSRRTWYYRRNAAAAEV